MAAQLAAISQIEIGNSIENRRKDTNVSFFLFFEIQLYFL